MIKHTFALASSLFLAGCVGTMPSIGDSSARTVATGSAGGSQTDNVNSKLERCSETLGTIAMVEDQQAGWYQTMRSHQLQSTIPVLRLLVQQSNCFVVVERGAGLRNMQQERDLERTGEMRSGSNFGRGQMVSADYTMSPSVTFSQKGTGGMGAALSSFAGGMFGQVTGGMKFNDASTMLTLVDNRSGVQLAAAEGSSRNTDFNLFGGLFGGGTLGSACAFTNTPEGKVLTAAFMDSYNQMVRALKNYKAQEIKGGLGRGGQLKTGQ